MTHQLLAPIVAPLLVLGFSATGSAHDPSALIERFGRLPAELVRAKKTDADTVDALYLAVLARLPANREKEVATKHLAAAKDRRTACLDLVWALVNTKEFLKLHGMDQNAGESLTLLNKIAEKWEKGKESEKEKK